MKNVLITGASGNLGKAAVEKFLGEGWRIIALVAPGKPLPFNFGDQFISYEADISDEKSVEVIMNKIIAEHKTIDAAILTVGGYASGNLLQTDAAALQKMFTLNFNTSYFIACRVLEHMLTQSSGRIILIGSRPAIQPEEGKNSVAYALSKSLIFTLADLINAEAKGSNVTASVIVPGTLDTLANRQALPNADFTSWVLPEHVAQAMHYLSSAHAGALRQTVLKMYGNA